MKRPFAELWGTGSYAPARVMTNDEFSKFLETSDQWIQENDSDVASLVGNDARTR